MFAGNGLLYEYEVNHLTFKKDKKLFCFQKNKDVSKSTNLIESEMTVYGVLNLFNKCYYYAS